MAAIAAVTIPVVIGTGVTVYGQRAAQKTTEIGAEAQAEVEEQGREFNQAIFDVQKDRQQPFVDVGNLALPDYLSAIKNEGDASNLPSAGIRRGIVGDFLGEQAPEFIKQNAFGDINAEETEINKARLQNLVNLGVGGVGGIAKTGANLASNLGSSFLNESDIKSQSLQDSAIARQNQQATILRSLSSIPALAVAANRR